MNRISALMIDFKIKLFGGVIGRRRLTNTAFFPWPCQKLYLKAYSTEHAKDLRAVEEVKRNPDDRLNILNLCRFYHTRPYPSHPIDVGDVADSQPGGS